MPTLLAFLFWLSSPVLAEVPALQAPVTDLGQVLSKGAVASLDQLIRSVKNQGGPQISVLTVPDLGGETIESYSIQVVDNAKLGTSKDDNGVLLLLALKERKVRIEVGQGLEGALPDAYSKRIVDLAIVPYLKRGDFDAAMEQGVVGILEYTFPQGLKDSQVQATHSRRSGGKDLKVILLLLGMWLFFQFLRPRRRRGLLGYGLGGVLGGMSAGGLGGWGGGSSGGGGSWGGGGGGFSGGGASGNW